MAKGDRVLFYHSGKEKAVVGVAQVVRGPYRDPTADEDRWVAVDLKPIRPLAAPVTLEAIRGVPSLSDIALLRKSRLSVTPLSKDAFQAILSMGGTAPSKKARG
jgi:predicted RNA-binding protein with PUA-like domain